MLLILSDHAVDKGICPQQHRKNDGCIYGCFQQIDTLFTADERQYQRGYIEPGQRDDTEMCIRDRCQNLLCEERTVCRGRRISSGC